MSRSRSCRLAPNVSRSISHIRNVSATTTAMTRTSLEIDMPPGSTGPGRRRRGDADDEVAHAVPGGVAGDDQQHERRDADQRIAAEQVVGNAAPLPARACRQPFPLLGHPPASQLSPIRGAYRKAAALSRRGREPPQGRRQTWRIGHGRSRRSSSSWGPTRGPGTRSRRRCAPRPQAPGSRSARRSARCACRAPSRCACRARRRDRRPRRRHRPGARRCPGCASARSG